MMPTEAETPPTTTPADPSARRLKVRRVKLSELVEDVGNPRRHDERDLAATEASLKAHGQVDPLVVQKGTMRLIAGHGRKEAMRRLGWKQAEIVEVECDDTEFRALSIRLNRTGELAGWNAGVLESALSELAEAGWGNLPDFGFDEAALDALAGGMDGDETTKRKKRAPGDVRTVTFTAGDDQTPDLADVVHSKRGEVYQLGPHRLMCGDCRDSVDVAKLLDGDKINLAFTSPPYAAQREYDTDSGFKPIPPDQFVAWFDAVQANVKANLADDGSWFVNIKEHCEEGERSLCVHDLVIEHKRKWGWCFVDELCWERIGMPGAFRGRFKNGWEPVFHFALRPGSGVKFHPESVGHASDNIPVYNIETNLNPVGSLTGIPATREEAQQRAKDRKTTVGIALPSNRLPAYQTDSTAHSAAFPVKLPGFFILAFTDEGDVVFDPFCGSGSLIIASARAGRRGYGIEISPKFCDLIRRRWTRWATENDEEPGTGALAPVPAPPF